MDPAERNVIIRAKGKDDYVFSGLEKEGNYMLIPYRDKNLLLRLLREAWFRLHLPARKIWYNPEIKKLRTDSITICDPLITPDFLEWICDLFPDVSFVVNYSNRVSRSGIKPSDVKRPNLRYQSFDLQDCEQYGMDYAHAAYMAQYSFSPEDKSEPEYDIVFVGRDKGRAEAILKWEKVFNEMGLRTYFRICADRSYLRFKKPYYKKEIPYPEYIELLKKTRAHLNYVQDGQTSFSQRDLESVFDEVKCVTNNKGIRSFELYHPSRFFILDEDDLDTLPHFLHEPFVPVSKEQLSEYGTTKTEEQDETK